MQLYKQKKTPTSPNKKIDIFTSSNTYNQYDMFFDMQ